jgi:hypothetical protein
MFMGATVEQNGGKTKIGHSQGTPDISTHFQRKDAKVQ